jgi:glycoprotein endo-alpha-1,2-mannosidase
LQDGLKEKDCLKEPAMPSSFMPKPAQVVLYRITSVVFLMLIVALIVNRFYVGAFVAALGSVALMLASFVVAKWAREEAEAERRNVQARAAMPVSPPVPLAYPPAYPPASPPGYAPPSAPPSYTPTPSLPPLPPMPNMPTGGTWDGLPRPPGLPPNVSPSGAPQQTPQAGLPKRSSASPSSKAWIGPTVTLIGMALFVVLAVSIVGYMANRSVSINADLPSEQAGNGRTSGPGRNLPERNLSPASPRTEKRVLALYYPWYRTPQHSHRWEHQSGVDVTHRRMKSHTHYPAQGPYDSADTAVLDRHLQQAAQAGIDTLVCSWWGRKDATDSALRLLLQRAAKTHIKICVLWEQVSGQAGTDALSSELAYLLETFGKQPAYLRVEDRPVVFVLNRVCHSADEDGWMHVRNEAAKSSSPGALLIGDGFQQAQSSVWNGYFLLEAAAPLIDGQTPAVCARVQNMEYANVLQMSRPYHRLSVVTVFPGYDDRKPNAALHIAGRTFLDRHDGQLYDALWQQAIADDPDWILVNSFNQWHAGTEIEPSVEMGDQYLRLTRQYAAQFKNRVATP